MGKSKKKPKNKPKKPKDNPSDTHANRAFKLGAFLRINYRFFAQNERSSIWMYEEDKGIWKRFGLNFIQQLIVSHFGPTYTPGLKTKVQDQVRFNSYDPNVELGGPPKKIVLANGVYNLDTDELEEFNADDYHITAIPVVYDPDAKCLNFEKFLKEVLMKHGDELKTNQDIKAMEEFFGYCLVKDYFYAIVALLIGEGENGKSTLLDVLIAFLGSDNIAAVPPQTFEEDKFSMAMLHGKLANIVGDIPASALRRTATLKKMTGGDPIYCQHKHLAPFNYVSFAKQIYSANQVPKTYDPSKAFFRRWRMIELPNTFLKEDENTIPKDELVAKLTSPGELSGIFNLAVAGLKRLRKQKMLTGEKTTDEKAEDFMTRSRMTIELFTNKYLHWDPLSPVIEKSLVHDLYRAFCYDKKCGYEEFTTFVKGVGRLLPNLKTKKLTNAEKKKTPHWLELGVYDIAYGDTEDSREEIKRQDENFEGPSRPSRPSLSPLKNLLSNKEGKGGDKRKKTRSTRSTRSSRSQNLDDCFNEPPDDVREKKGQSPHPPESKEGE